MSKDDIRADILDVIRAGIDTARDGGHVVAPGGFGVLEVYDRELSLIWLKNPDRPCVCPIGAAALSAPPIPKIANSRARNTDEIERALGCTLAVPPDYIHGFAHGFDGHERWAALDYGNPWIRGYEDGAAVRREEIAKGEIAS